MAWTIYCHIHHESGRRYIGLTKRTWQERWRGHVHGASSGVKTHFAAAIRKYGKDAFSHEILQVCLTLEEANVAEQHWIDLYDTRNPLRGFNLAPGGTHTPHKNCLDYLKDPNFKEKASARSRKVWQDPRKRSNILSATQDAIRTPEVRKKLSDSVRALWEDSDYRESQTAALRERAKDPVLCETFRRSWDDPDFRERCSVGPRSYAAAQASKEFCVNGHERVFGNLDASRECKICIHERRVRDRTHCPGGHEYSPENTRVSSSGRRVCLTCLGLVKAPRPCAKCGGPKDMKVGNRMRCRPCSNARISAWKREQRSSKSAMSP